MKKILISIILLASLPLFATAQQITASPLEGRWTWNQKGTDDPGYTELIFFGNVMLGGFDDDWEYQGNVFTHTGRAITFDDGYTVWQYRVSGSTLTITDEDNVRFTYVRATTTRSPLEGIWRITGGSVYSPDEAEFFLFTGDILAFGGGSDYMGGKIIFSGNQFYFAYDYDEDLTAKELEEFAVEYTVRGNTLTIKADDDDGEITFTKVY